ncbi:rifamycin-inactivating phosphotransferase [Nonomuraea roseoviolacea]|uniref:Pyruvate,water dikinase n=1 Tax=Nonomuraea roseoviolacea subsp. carminata TaxID=160689 RepID=A0ABT1JZ22_9ACTN|nr:rifamycin-inactivating phosphotransferase [Nonomuraea roseoviolacea]MCP2346506.1 pyruvate,water dikinase [Nonomuraea roseoviolacea subsp. carminata]
MSAYVLGFHEIDRTALPRVGGKGANLGELSSIEGVRVPGGFCVTTEAYRAVVERDPAVGGLIDDLAGLRAGDRAGIARAAGRLRDAIEALPVPEEIEKDVARRLADLAAETGTAGEVACAVRSSATAEDLPSSSFAGQQDTYLNVRGERAVVDAVRRCWASLFTDRAVAYRVRNGFDHRAVRAAVVVQRMVFPDAAGIMFTADPVTSNRRVVSIDAGFGLGEAFVSGLVDADNYRVRDGRIIGRRVATQTRELRARAGGGTEERPVEEARRHAQTLDDARILRLERLGRRIEAHFGRPQDIEWALADGEFHVLQSRPVTTIYPVPRADDDRNHVYISYGHRQMMTDAFTPLGLSMFEMFHRKLGRTAGTVAGNRFYKDLSPELSSPLTRAATLKSVGQADVLMAAALRAVLARKDFAKDLARRRTSLTDVGPGGPLPLVRQYLKLSREDDPRVVPDLIARTEATVEELRRSLAGASGDALFAAIEKDHDVIAGFTFDPRSVAAALVGIMSVNWVDKHLAQWLGVRDAADAVSQSADHNVVAAMGLDLLAVSDVVREHPEAAAYLETAERDTFFTGLAGVEGGEAVRRSLEEYLRAYGMHGQGGIDITRTRWSEDPTLLVPLILSNVRALAPGERERRAERGRAEAERTMNDLLERIRKLPGGSRKAARAARRMSLIRHFIGYREYSKHALLQRYELYKRALLAEARRLALQGVVEEPEDVYFLSFEELRQVVNTGRLDRTLITERRAAHETYRKLTPPRVITSEGEVIDGAYDTGTLPEGALPGVAVSSGVVEGRARVVLDMADAEVEEGDILVTVFTDPSWSPLFVSVKGVVMEVGGVMTHGAVVAREYGLPSVVGVEGATRRIRDGQRIRVNGSEGYVEVLPDEARGGQGGAREQR